MIKQQSGKKDLTQKNMAQYYDSSKGAFIWEDAVKDDTNWYIHGNNNPLMFNVC